MALAYRTVFYRGVMRGRLQAETDENEQAQDEETVAPTRAALESNPATAGLIDWG